RELVARPRGHRGPRERALARGRHGRGVGRAGVAPAFGRHARPTARGRRPRARGRALSLGAAGAPAVTASRGSLRRTRRRPGFANGSACRSRRVIAVVQTARTPSQIQRDVLYALLLREIGALFGRSRVGLLWVFVEPVAHLVVP